MAIIAGLACVDGVFLEESLEQKAEYLRGVRCGYFGDGR